MPPRRPLPDLCLISVFKMLTPNNQLKAAKMSPRCAILVRAANRPVKMLVVAHSESFDVNWTKAAINRHSLASYPLMQLLPAGGEPFPDYPINTLHLSKWSCLLVNNNQLLDQATVEQIVNVFSAITNLKFCDYSSENLIALLQHPQWANQLTNLAVFCRVHQPLLIATINALPVLQCLEWEWKSGSKLLDLTILAQLKMIAFDVNHSSSVYDAFLRSLECHAKGNVGLQVHLFDGESDVFPSLLCLSEPLCTCIVRYGSFYLDWARDDVSLFCRQFSSLTSVAVYHIEIPQLEALFTALSTLSQLVRLDLWLHWTKGEEVNNQLNEQQPFRRPMTQLTSVRALELRLHLSNHSQVQELNLAVTLPRLQAIYIEGFYCESCGIYLFKYLSGNYITDSKPNTSTALECLCASLPLLHPGVPHDRIILSWKKPFPTLEQLLSATH